MTSSHYLFTLDSHNDYNDHTLPERLYTLGGSNNSHTSYLVLIPLYSTNTSTASNNLNPTLDSQLLQTYYIRSTYRL
jgi:hypothetical protein